MSRRLPFGTAIVGRPIGGVKADGGGGSGGSSGPISATDITDSTAAGRSLLTAASIDAITALLALSSSDLSDVTAFVRTLLDDADAATFRQTLGVRNVLSADRIYYVRKDGNDANTGLANTAGGAFLTIQKAINTVAALDMMTYSVSIYVGTGTYVENVSVNAPFHGSGTVTLEGSPVNPANFVIAPSSGSALSVGNGGRLRVNGLKFDAVGGWGIALNRGYLDVVGPVNFGAASAGHILVENYSRFVCESVNYTISGAAPYHILAQNFSIVRQTVSVVTITGTPAFSTRFVAIASSYGTFFSVSYSGSATGSRYLISDNGIANTFGGGASYFAGDTVGATTTQGQYI